MFLYIDYVFKQFCIFMSVYTLVIFYFIYIYIYCIFMFYMIIYVDTLYTYYIFCLFIYSVFIYIYSSGFDHVGEFEHVLCVRSFCVFNHSNMALRGSMLKHVRIVRSPSLRAAFRVSRKLRKTINQ